MTIKKIADLDEFLGLLASTEPDKLVSIMSPLPTFHFYKAADKIDGFSGADEAKLTALTEKYLRTEI
ncbi:hypothetical protein EC968_001599 [Mortierella alpina]|nr:hypothetical protein EC968_001599 [Mortierella alpina]